MKLTTFTVPGDAGERVGCALPGGRIVDLTSASRGDARFGSMLSLIDAGPGGLETASGLVRTAAPDFVHPADQVQTLAPIPRPRKNVYCVGLNFRSHVEQNAAALGEEAVIPETPLFFSKPTTAVIGPGKPIPLDSRLTSKLDYEVELAVIIAKAGTWISEETADEHIFGYTLANDVSARDLQWRASQFLYGKGLDGYCPLGPAIVTRDEFPALVEVTLELSVNGELRQRESAGNMLFSPQQAISHLSQGITLEAGDVITLGTPGGCGYQMIPTRFLQPGDAVECRADGIGTLANPVASV